MTLVWGELLPDRVMCLLYLLTRTGPEFGSGREAFEQHGNEDPRRRVFKRNSNCKFSPTANLDTAVFLAHTLLPSRLSLMPSETGCWVIMQLTGNSGNWPGACRYLQGYSLRLGNGKQMRKRDLRPLTN